MSEDPQEYVDELDGEPVAPVVGVISQGPLANRQHEAFCVLVSSGMSMKNAFEQVFGYCGSAVDVNDVLCAPGVNQRIASIAHHYNSTMHMTVLGHLEMLAAIRDTALGIQEVGVAFQCERARGEVAGLYDAASSPAVRRIKIGFSPVKKNQRMLGAPAEPAIPRSVDVSTSINTPIPSAVDASIQVAFE